ncbi:MAG: hypothetical protein ACI4RA_07550 [Kiritimatiellia bacterium]
MNAAGKRTARAGQAMIETIVVLFFTCLVFFAVYEYASLLTARTVLDYAAARAARARTVGFNDFMVTKTVRVATLSTAGRCLTQDDDGGELSTGALVSRMGSYLESEYEADVRGILDFELWEGDKLGWTCSEPGGPASALTMRVWQRRPLYGASFAEESGGEAPLHSLESVAEIEGHYPFYLQ